MWRASYHVTEETSRFILSTGLISRGVGLRAAQQGVRRHNDCNVTQGGATHAVRLGS